MPMIQYWKYKLTEQAKVTYSKDGALVMKIAGEKEDFPGFPRGYLLFRKLSKLKHEIKNQIFNDSWRLLEEGKSEEEIAARIKGEVLDRIFTLAEETKYDRVPPKRMHAPVRELYRAWTKVNPSERSLKLRDITCFILQEDDSYRFRLQWMVGYFRPRGDMIGSFGKALGMLQQGEVVRDMKDKQRLLKRVLLVYARHSKSFIPLMKEIDWKKMKLSKADKYHFRGKYFKVDMDLFDY